MAVLDRLALIVLNYNSYDDTVFCVDRLISFDALYHIVIVDNASPDGSGQMLADRYADQVVVGDVDSSGTLSKTVDVICSEQNGGYGAGNNIGIRYADEQYDIDTVAIVNPDVEIQDISTIVRLYDVINSEAVYAVAGGRIVSGNYDEQCNINYSCWPVPTYREVIGKQSLFSRRYDRPFEAEEITENIYEVGCVAGCFFLAKLSCFKEIGLFDENIFMYNEEDLLGFKCVLKGYKTVLVMDAIYHHNHKPSEQEKKSFVQKIHSTEASYKSAGYILREAYSGRGLFGLLIVEVFNRFYLACCFIKTCVLEKKAE